MNKIRLGSIEFINSLPVDLGLLRGTIPSEAEIIQGSPAALNEKMLSGDLDLGPISVFWYAQHQEEWLLLPELSISSESGVQSVLLFSRHPFAELKGKRIALTGKGRTTPALLSILCQRKYGFMPVLVPTEEGRGDVLNGADAVLLIGDEALEAREKYSDSKFQVIDLAEEWRDWTGEPVVFAVWAVRRASWNLSAEKVLEVHQQLLKSKEWGAQHPAEVLNAAEKKTHLPLPVLKAYFSRLSYGFDKKMQAGMKRYLDEAVRCGLLQPAKPFEFITDGSAALTAR